ncbi:hypothetical protein OSB04_017018 [Centaurea solstitialis]|uniref:Uncharacterized protein n=1 Tax=Centaurea solstitialis TaxID=347529 RepID=A0AA38T254_9ASTR|nr:hypothetical protein OSB04_017018 [Centaurea solstitialis]
MNVVTLREALQLPTLEELNLEKYSPSPTDAELMEFLEFMIINFYLTGKVGSHDQSAQAMLSIMYGIYFDLPLDFAQLIFEACHPKLENSKEENSKTAKKKDLVNLILHRFFGLYFSYQLATDLAPAKPLAKYYPLQEFKPMNHVLGYENPRPLSKAMLQHLDKESRKAYIRGHRRPESVPTNGDKEEPEVASEREIEGEENTPKRVDRSEVPKPKQKKKSKRKVVEVTEGHVIEDQPQRKKIKKKKAKRTEETITKSPSPVCIPSPQCDLSPIQEEAAPSPPKRKLKRLCKRSTSQPILTRVLMKSSPPVELIKEGDKVGSSEAAHLAKLGTDLLSTGYVNYSAF